MSTERSDKVSNALFDGKIAIIVNGSPFVLILPAVFLDFLKSPEDDKTYGNFFCNLFTWYLCSYNKFPSRITSFRTALCNC